MKCSQSEITITMCVLRDMKREYQADPHTYFQEIRAIDLLMKHLLDELKEKEM